MDGSLKLGERIPESRLAGQLHVSRPPVHTALLELEQDGLVTLLPNIGARVASYSAQDLHDIGTIRLSLDSMAVRLASLYGSRADFLSLRKCAEDCRHGMLTGDRRLQREADCDFHLLLAKISRNGMPFELQTKLYKRVNFILLSNSGTVNNRPEHVQEHFDLIDAISNQEQERAHSLITRHLATFYDLEKQYPPGFFISN